MFLLCLTIATKRLSLITTTASFLSKRLCSSAKTLYGEFKYRSKPLKKEQKPTQAFKEFRTTKKSVQRATQNKSATKHYSNSRSAKTKISSGRICSTRKEFHEVNSLLRIQLTLKTSCIPLGVTIQTKLRSPSPKISQSHSKAEKTQIVSVQRNKKWMNSMRVTFQMGPTSHQFTHKAILKGTLKVQGQSCRQTSLLKRRKDVLSANFRQPSILQRLKSRSIPSPKLP